MNHPITILLAKGRPEPPVSQSLENELLDALKKRSGIQLLTIPHLYDLQEEGPIMERLRAIPGNLIVLAWLYPRAAYWVLDANEIRGRMGQTSFFSDDERETVDRDELPDRTISCIDLRSAKQAGPILDEIDRLVAQPSGEPSTAVSSDHLDENARPRWYPVIDYGRCKNCLECLNFCLFGVFGVDKSGQLFVEQADACRNGCPACSRVCSSEAILFPHHTNPGIAGDPAVSPSQSTMNLIQLFDAPTLAASERDKALAEKAAEKDELDDLVDELDEMDL